MVPSEPNKPPPSWLMSALSALMPVRRPFDPAAFADPMAQQIDWSPAKGGGSSFCTHKLVQQSPHRLQFRATLGAWIFYLVFAVAGGLVVGAVVLGTELSRATLLRLEFLVPFLLGSVFLVLGLGLIYFNTMPIVFDKSGAFFCKGRTMPSDVANPRSLRHYAPFSEIYALQLLSERCSSKNGSFFSHELNLVLRDKRRINVVDHGNLTQLRADAQTLAAFLDRPLWDGLS